MSAIVVSGGRVLGSGGLALEAGGGSSGGTQIQYAQWTSTTTTTVYLTVSGPYSLYRNGALIGTGLTSTTYNDSGLTASTASTASTYTYSVTGSGGFSVTMPSVYFPNFSGSPSSINIAGNGAFSGNLIRLINDSTNPHNSCGVWYTTKQIAGSFSTTFSLTSQLGSSDNGGFAFGIQSISSSGGGTDYAADANGCGFERGYSDNPGPPTNSVFIKFDAGYVPGEVNNRPGQFPSTTGIYFNEGPAVPSGANPSVFPGNDLVPYGVNWNNDDTFEITMVYDGSLLTLTINDTTSGNQARITWPLSLANTTATTSNYIGFTAGTPGVGLWLLNNWVYIPGYPTRLATPTFSPAAGSYSSSQSVSINYPVGSSCYYTTNGLLPTAASTLYTGPITVSAFEVIQAVSIQTGYTDSLIGEATYSFGDANSIDYPNGFSAGDLIPCGYGYFNSPSSYRVADGATTTTGAVWFPIAVPVTSGFSTTFQIQFGTASGNGMCFVWQNSPPLYTSSTGAVYSWGGGPTAYAIGQQCCGYGGINGTSGGTGLAYGLLNSVAICFDLYTVSNSVGLYTNGATPTGNQTATGFTFSGNTFNVTLSYSGTTLSISMQQSSGGTTFTYSWSINIPSTVGSNSAYAGFTGGTGGATGIMQINSWTYSA